MKYRIEEQIKDMDLQLWQQLGVEVKSLDYVNEDRGLITFQTGALNGYTEYDVEDVCMEVVAGATNIKSIEAHDLGHFCQVEVHFYV